MFGIKYNFRKNCSVVGFFFFVCALSIALYIVAEKKSKRRVSSRNFGTLFWLNTKKVKFLA